MSNVGDMQVRLAGTLGLDEGGESATRELFAVVAQYSHASAEAAGVNVANTRIWTNPYSFPVKIRSAIYAPDGALTASNTDYATITLYSDDAAAGAKVTSHVIATTLNSATGASGNWTQNIAVNFALSNAAGSAVPARGSLYFGIVKTGGTGVDVPAGTIFVNLEKL